MGRMHGLSEYGDPHGPVADRELQLAATTQYQERGSYGISLAQENIKFKIQSSVSSECILLSHHPEVNNITRGSIISWGQL